MDALKDLASWLCKAKVEIKPHPPEVADVHPSVIASMKRRLKTKPSKGPLKPKKDIMDDSVHMAPVKKSEPLLALEGWLAKACMGKGDKKKRKMRKDTPTSIGTSGISVNPSAASAIMTSGGFRRGAKQAKA